MPHRLTTSQSRWGKVCCGRQLPAKHIQIIAKYTEMRLHHQVICTKIERSGMTWCSSQHILSTHFCVEDMFGRVAVMRAVESNPSLRFCAVPMNSAAPCPVFRLSVCESSVDPHFNGVWIVVEGNILQRRMVSFHHWHQVLRHKLRIVLKRVATTIPHCQGRCIFISPSILVHQTTDRAGCASA